MAATPAAQVDSEEAGSESWRDLNLYAPTPEHALLAQTLREFVEREVEPQALAADRDEHFNRALFRRAGELGLLGVPAFMFHEGGEPVAALTFKQIARLTGGAYCRFDAGSAGQLRELLAAVAVYAAGGQDALEDLSRTRGGNTRLLLEQMK